MGGVCEAKNIMNGDADEGDSFILKNLLVNLDHGVWQRKVQTDTIVYKTNWIHSLHIIIHGKEVINHAMEKYENYGSKSTTHCRLAIKEL